MKKLIVLLVLFAVPCFAADKTLTWDSVDPKATQVDIYQAEMDSTGKISAFSLIGSVVATDKTFMVTGIDDSKVYFFQAYAKNPFKQSIGSNVLFFSTALDPLTIK